MSAFADRSGQGGVPCAAAGFTPLPPRPEPSGAASRSPPLPAQFAGGGGRGEGAPLPAVTCNLSPVTRRCRRGLFPILSVSGHAPCPSAPETHPVPPPPPYNTSR